MFEKKKYVTAVMSVTGGFERISGERCDKRAHELLLEGPSVAYGVNFMKQHGVSKYMAVSAVAVLLSESLKAGFPDTIIGDFERAIWVGMIKRKPEWNANASSYVEDAQLMAAEFRTGIMKRWGEPEDSFFDKLRRWAEEGGMELTHPMERREENFGVDP